MVAGDNQDNRILFSTYVFSTATLMGSLTFNLLDKTSGTYFSADTTNEVLKLYYLAATPPTNDDPVEFATIWSATASGYYFFLPIAKTISDYGAFAKALKATLGDAQPTGLRWIAWLNDPTVTNNKVEVTSFLPLILSAGSPAQTTAITKVNLLNIYFNIPETTSVSTGGSAEAPLVQLQNPIAGGNNMTLVNPDPTHTLEIAHEEAVSIPFTGAHIGVYSFAASWDRGNFYTLFIPKGGNIFSAPPSAELRFQYNEAAPVNFRYPSFIGQIPNPQKADSLFLNASLDVMNPTDGNRTRFAFDLDKFTPTIALPVSDAHRSSTGSTLYISPKADPADTTDPLKVAGFAVANRPNENDNNNHVLYLVPIGNYAVESTAPADAPPTPGLVNVMCGLVGTEFLLAAESDLLEFTNQAKSLATGYSPDSKTNTDTVADTYTTSWLRLIPGPNSATVFPGNLKESYCVQAPNSVYYSPGSEEGFLLATGVRLASLADTSKTIPFPMVPYGTAYYSDSALEVEVANPNIPATTLTSFEFDVLSPLRRRLIEPDLCNGPIFFRAATGEPLEGGFVRTPVGLLAELNDGTTPANTPAGTLKRLMLAKSPVNGKYLQFTAAPSIYCSDTVTDPPTVVRPKLSTALMHNSVFLVASNASIGSVGGSTGNIGPFDNEIQLGEFTYQVNLTGQPLADAGGKMTIMLFKFSSIQSVEDLATDTNQWTDAADFVGDAAAVTDVSGRITSAITEAKTIIDGGGDAAVYFQDFYNKMTDPKWTGMIVLNCELDYELLPTDIQVLLGGIDGELVAHHFGVTVNQIKATTSNQLDIDNSSLFSLIYYDKAYANTSKTFDFQVTKLNVLYVNSVLTHFQSQIAMTVKELYGDPVTLVKGGTDDIKDQDAIVINGVYLKDGESGHIVFDSTVPRYFTFPHDSGKLRVLENVVINDATLIPVSSVDNGNGTTTVKAAFRLNGEFGFTLDISSDASGVDLFSYPINPSTGTANQHTLNFTCNDLDWDTILEGNSAAITYPIVTDLTNLKLEATNADPRDNSLVATFPLNLTGFNHTEGGLSASSLGAKQVTGMDTLTGTGAAPVYSLVFSLAMGNLGALTDGTALQATVYLGWSPAGSTSGSNNVSMLFVPPSQFSTGDGGFKLQGVIETVYGDLTLNRFPLETGGDEMLFVLQLHNVQLSIVSIALITAYQNPSRVLTFFGDPNKPKGSNLSWFLSNSGGSSSPVDAIVVPLAGLMNGIKVNTELTGTQVISKAINDLNTLSSTTDADMIQSIYAQKEIGNTTFQYDPTAGVLFFVDLEFMALTFKLLFADPSFYGGLIKLGDPARKPKDSGGDGEEKKGFLDKWGGLEIELDYRKISDGLGVISVDFVLPESLRVLPSAEVPTNFTIPSFGLEVFTNGDFKIEIGWPFSSTDSFSPGGEQAKLAFVVDGIPLFVSIGLYFAKLRGADVPDQFPKSFQLIYMFGLGLAFGIDAKYPSEPKAGGVISAEFQLFIWGSFQGMLVSKTGSIGADGLDYQWWTATIGVTVHVGGKVDLKIIVASIEIEATLYISLAIETGHKTEVIVGADFKIEVSIKILFVTIHIRFKHHFQLAKWDIGDGPVALASGPTPCALDEYKSECGEGEALAEPMVVQSKRSIEDAVPMASYAVERKNSQFSEAIMADTTMADTAVADSTPVAVTIYYLLQPTTLSTDGSTWLPQAISSLVMEFSPNNSGNGNADATPFANIITALANQLLSKVPAGSFSAQVDAMSTLVHEDNYYEEADDFISGNFVFTIEPSSKIASGINAVVFPMFPQCELTYNGSTTAFNGPEVPADYIQQLQQYLNQYSSSSEAEVAAAAATASAPVTSVEDLFFKDYFVMVAQQLVFELQNAITNGATNLADALKQVNNANIAGFVSHFMLGGIRLPKFSGSTVQTGDDDWQGMYQLTGLQTELVKSGENYVTAFTLGLADASAASYIKFAEGKDTLAEDFPVNQILSAQPSLSWLTAPGGGISVLDPLVSSEKTYHLSQPNSYTNGSAVTKLFPLPNAMQRELETLNGLQVALSLIADSANGSSQTSNQSDTVVNGIPTLFIPITVNKVALPDAAEAGSYYPNTYAIKGTDQYNRELLELLLTQYDSSDELTFMIGTGNNAYVAPKSTANIVMVKNNLSTDAEPDTMLQAPQADLQTGASALGPVQASLADGEDFLRLIWEESVVRTAGYYLYVEDVPDSAFTGETATFAIMISSGSAASTIKLSSYHNLIAISETLGKGALAAAVQDEAGNPVLVYQPNYAPGSTGFTAKWLNADTAPDISNPSQYIESLYRTVQFQVDSIEGTTPPAGGFNWSRPNGANSEAKSATTADWLFRQTIPASKFVNPDPYQAVGKKVDMNIRILDAYGNALPESLVHPLSANIVYNDPLVAFADLQWFKIAYAINGDSGSPVLEVEMSFDAATVTTILQNASNAEQQIAQALAQYATAVGQFQDTNTSLALNTTLAGSTFTKDSAGNNLKTDVQNFLQAVATFLQTPTSTPPAAASFSIDLDPSYVAGLENILFVVNVEMVASRAASALDTDVTKLLPRVGSVTNILLPFVTPDANGDSDLTNTPSIAAFAEQFEKAYEGFDGADGQLKVGKGSDFSEGLQNAKKSAIWAIKWSKSAGMGLTVPFAAAPAMDNHPVFYAPPPLSTKLITETVSVIEYKSTWDGTSNDIINGDLDINFANIDMDAWAIQFFNVFHDFINPEMAAAIAKLDGTTYDSLMQYKNNIAEAVSQSIQEIIKPKTGELTSDLDSAQEKMLQSLLASLTNDYGTSALVQLVSDVIVNGQVESGVSADYPPLVFGKVSANLPTTDQETPYTVSNANVPIVQGDQYLNFLISAKHPEAQADLNLDLFYDIGFINHQFEPEEEENGFVPSSWVTVVLPTRETTNGTKPPLQVPLSELDIPIPLRAFPAPPSFGLQQAVTKPDSTDIEDLVQWTYQVEVSRPKAAQDELILEVTYNEDVDGDEHQPQVSKGVALTEDRAAPETLFEALARFAYEYPEIQAHLDTIPGAAFSGQKVPEATAALSRMSALIEGVAGTWGTWTNPAANLHSARLGSFTGGDAEAGIQLIDQRYSFEFSNEGKTITVTGISYSSADDQKLADLPYPEIASYSKGAVSNNTCIYTFNGSTVPESLTLSFTGLNIGTHQSAISRAYIERNADIAPEGYETNTAFVFRTSVVSFKNPIVPLIEANNAITLAAESTLSTVISKYFANYLGTGGEVGTVEELQFTLEAGAEFLMSKDTGNPSEHTLLSQTPILFSQQAVATPSNTTGQPPTKLSDYEASLTQQLVNWHKAASKASPTQKLYMSFTLFADVSESKLPLLRIRELLIDPPADNDGWWS